MQSLLKQYANIKAEIFWQGQTPLAVALTHSNGISIRIDLDAVDSMAYAQIPSLSHLPAELRQYFLACLADVIRYQLGGKCLFAVAPTEISLLQDLNLVGIKPLLCKDQEYFRNLMVAEAGPQCLQHFVSYQPAFKLLQTDFSFTSDKLLLSRKAKQISRLLIDNASWAGDAPENRRTYGVQAILERLNHPHIEVYAAVHRQTQNVEAFLRVYQLAPIHYLGDLVVSPKRRGQGLAMQLMQIAMLNVPQQHKMLLIAGDEHLVSLYRKISFNLVSEVSPVYLSQDLVLMSAVHQKQVIIRRYQHSFPVPIAPKLCV